MSMQQLKKLIEKRGDLVSVLLGVVLLFYFYSEIILSPNQFVFSPGGDGIKNYYAYLFHAKYDAEFWNFSGMNYPYYEHIVYTDGHPLLSWLIGVFGLADYGIGILNLLMLFSFPAAAFFLYKILTHYNVKPSWSVLASVAIAFLSPQVFRMTGHFSLSYVFAIPALWWLMTKCVSGNKIKWSLVILFYMLLFFFTHPYLGMILCFFSLFFWLTKTILNRPTWKINLLSIFIQVFLPIMLFQFLVMLTDTHESRLGEPAGFFDYYASWKSVFVPHDGPLAFFTHKLQIDVGNWESWNYVGFTTVLFAFFTLAYLIKKRKDLTWKRISENELAIFMIAAWLILLFAFCFPLKYHFLRGIVDLFGPLKQFRVLGRFGWIFYYVFTVFVVVGFYKSYLVTSKKWVYQIVFLAGIIFYGLEFSANHKIVASVVSSAKNPFLDEHLPQDVKELNGFIENSDYNALMVMPFQHMSSENIMMLGSEQANYNSFIISYHTQKPLLNSITSRMSLTEAIWFNNFFSPEFIEKELVYDLPDTAKILIIKNKDLLDESERRLLYCSKPVFENESFKAFEFLREKWNSSFYFDAVVEQEKVALTDVGKGWNSDTSGVWFDYVSYDETTGESLGGSGSKLGNKGGYDVVYELNTTGMDSGLYNVSFWYYLLEDRPDILAVAEQDSTGDRKSFWFDQAEVSQSTFIVENWCFVSLDFYVSPWIEKMNLILTGNGNGQPYRIDELLVIKSGQSPLFRRETKNNQEYIIYNNYWIKANSFQR